MTDMMAWMFWAEICQFLCKRHSNTQLCQEQMFLSLSLSVSLSLSIYIYIYRAIQEEI
jgi:hypothetical protein